VIAGVVSFMLLCWEGGIGQKFSIANKNHHLAVYL